MPRARQTVVLLVVIGLACVILSKLGQVWNSGDDHSTLFRDVQAIYGGMAGHAGHHHDGLSGHADHHDVPAVHQEILIGGKIDFDKLVYFPDKKPTLCAPVKEEDLGPFPKGVKYGKPVKEARHVLYNSVPKCGSRTLVWIMWELQGHYNLSNPTDFEYALDAGQESKKKSFLMDKFQAAKGPTFFHGHIRYIRFEDSQAPVYISILREPISRFTSWYYFMRHGDADMPAEVLMKQMSGVANVAPQNETIDDCFAKGRADCTLSMYQMLQMMMFCGYNKICDDPNKRTDILQIAKKNLDKFLMVGLMEEFEDSVRVLEKLMPSTFGGGSVFYKKLNSESLSASKTKMKTRASPATEALMREKFREEIEFYEYAKQKFHTLKAKLGIGKTPNC